jgi:uncharacterized membrane protein
MAAAERSGRRSGRRSGAAAPSARSQVALAAAAGAAAFAALVLLAPVALAADAGWDVAAAVYMAWVWATVWPLDAADTGRLAEQEDPTRPLADVLVLAAAVGSLVAAGFVVGRGPRAEELLWIGLGVASVVLSWGVVHTVFTLRYARLYYIDVDGGVDFNQPDPPAFRDFAYLAFTIGMTFQVSDTPVSDPAIRATALRHALLSFVFVTGIVAATINLVASLGSR